MLAHLELGHIGIVEGDIRAPMKQVLDHIDDVFAGLPPGAVPIEANKCPAFVGYQFAAS